MMDKGIWKILVTSIILSLGIILLVVSPFIGVTGANPAGVGCVSGVALEAGMTSLEEEVGISAYANVGEKGKLTYTNAEYGFSIECPEDWAVNEGYMGFPVMFAGSIKDDFMINVIVEIEELPTKMTAIYEYAKAAKGLLSEEFKIVKTFNDTINGEPVSGIIFTDPMEGGFWFKQMQAYFVSDTTAYILAFGAASSTYDVAEENYFDPMLRSFKFTEKEAGIENRVFIVTPSKVEAGEEVKIKFEAVNEADVEKTKTFFLLVSPPGTLPTETIDFKTVTLAPGEREEIEFTFIPKETGEHTLYVEDKFWVIAVDHEKEAGAESGAPTSGRWIGTTSKGKAVAFNVTNTQVNNFSISYSYSCSGSHGLRTVKHVYPPIDIIENKFQYYSNDKWIYGEFTSPNFATGTYRETWRDRTSPWSVTCDSGKITWSARKVSGPSTPTPYYVNPGESIQVAVDSANAGDTIIVRDGTYNENVEVNASHITIKSENGSGNCSVNALVNTSDVFVVSADYVNISGFTVTGATAGKPYYAAGIHLDNASYCNISDNVVMNNCNGIFLYSSSNNTLTNNKFSNNDWIYLDLSSNNLIYNNYFNNTNNADDNGNNTWNITKTEGTNIIGGAYLGGNYWSDYAGEDSDGDGLGDTMLPYNSSGSIINGGDWLPLTMLALTPPPTPTPTPKILFSDDFSDEDSGWVTYDEYDGRVIYKDGCLYVKDYTKYEGTMYGESQRYFTDFILEVETRLVGGTDDNWHIVACRFKDEDNFYGFAISADGYYTIDKEVNGKVEVLAGPTYSAYIHQGQDVTNRIHVECIGSSLSLSVNGHLLRKVTDATFTGGDIALGANSLAGTFTEVAFDNLTVTKP